MRRFKLNRIALVSPVILSCMLGACAADNSLYPSLSRRAAEISAVKPVPAASESPASTGVKFVQSARLTALVDQARAAHKVFDSRVAKAEKTAQPSGEVGSESWGSMQIALADLESARSDVMIVLADLDALYAEARVNGQDATMIIQARDTVTELVRVEDAALARLRQAN